MDFIKGMAGWQTKKLKQLLDTTNDSSIFELGIEPEFLADRSNEEGVA